MEQNSVKISYKHFESKDERFPFDTINAAFIENKIAWKTWLNFNIDRISKDSHDVKLVLRYDMVELENLDKEILSFTTYAIVNCKGLMSQKGKFELIQMILQMCIWNSKGVYAAKTENTIYGTELPFDSEIRDNDLFILNTLKNEWR